MFLKELLLEKKITKTDPEMDDYYDDKKKDEEETKDSPYFVKWSGQSHEWYGDGDPDSDNGRYKQKGDGGKVVAINIEKHSQAKKLADKLDAMYKENKFPDKFVYGKMGEDHYLVDYHGAEVVPMAQADDWDKRAFKHDKPKDYSK